MSWKALVALVLSITNTCVGTTAVLLLRAGIQGRAPLSTAGDHVVLAVMVLAGAVVTMLALIGATSSDRSPA